MEALLSLRKSLLEEVRSIEHTDDDPVVELLHEKVEQIEFGYSEAERRHFERIEQGK